jgi:ribosomal protein S12 methylthiotransferase accessory factor
LTLPTEFPEKYKAAIFRTVDLCTVKKHIMSPPEIKIDLI